MKLKNNLALLMRDNPDSMDYAVNWLLPHSQSLIKKNEPDASTILKDLLQRILVHAPCITLVLQDDYIDRIFRDCYYIHFSSKHFEISRYCTRLFLFLGDQRESVKGWDRAALQQNFIGTIVFKPITCGAIGRTLINPYYLFDEQLSSQVYLRTSEYKVLLHGIDLCVKAFPYSMQDSETLTCAEVTILNIMDYYSNQYADYGFVLPSQIHRISQNNSFERTLPTTGMAYWVVSKVLSEFGFFPRLYRDVNIPESVMKRLLHYYVESAIPVAVGIEQDGNVKHSLVCIGHGHIDEAKMMQSLNSISAIDPYVHDDPAEVSTDRFYIADTANACDDYIVMNDNYMPYSVHSFTKSEDKPLSLPSYRFNDAHIEYLAVPLYRRMFLEAKDAFAVCTEILSNSHFKLSGVYREVFGREIGTRDNPLIIRLFMASSRSFRRSRISQFEPDEKINSCYYATPFPRFIWVCELYDLEHFHGEHTIGEIIIDATSSNAAVMLNSVIMINFPKRIATRHFGLKTGSEAPDECADDEGDMQEFERTDWRPLKRYSANLDAVSDISKWIENKMILIRQK